MKTVKSIIRSLRDKGIEGKLDVIESSIRNHSKQGYFTVNVNTEDGPLSFGIDNRGKVQLISEVSDNKIEDTSKTKDINKKDSYVLVLTGGSIGEKSNYIPQLNARAVKSGNDKEALQKEAKRLNESLSPGEKKYYKMHYSVKEFKDSYKKAIKIED